ncbi:quinone oxidoreductase family protein [Plantactinospora endophytica]|uniref:Quinone oxidoreductase n=1 Tax=Plantactinospora endophytica TaxID=673535 RepID=A0ABQ4E804_9ACTN|nr:quinone oxidoreductase [Plantactinospora endophytica]GIG90855.1 quinone oxidoreductase [Plantactinospora endophytica]
MRAVLMRRHGGPEVLESVDVPTPQLGAGQILVDVAAVGVNFADVYQRQGVPSYAGNLPAVPGQEGAGTVAGIGPGVDGFAMGDRVAWVSVPGGYAEQAAIPAERAVPVPEEVDFRVAAAAMMQGLTAHYLSHTTHPVASGEPVVVHAAAGGVGGLLTQLVKLRGGVVLGTTSSDRKAELARQAGADHVARYDTFLDTVRKVTDGAGAAVVYDGVGRATFDDSLAALRPRGLLVAYGASSGPVPPLETERLAAGGSLYLTRPTLPQHIGSRAELLARAADVFGWIAAGRLSIRIGATYPLADASRAHADLEGRRTSGKSLLLPG